MFPTVAPIKLSHFLWELSFNIQEETMTNLGESDYDLSMLMISWKRKAVTVHCTSGWQISQRSQKI